MLFYVSIVYSFVLLGSVPCYKCTLFIHSLVNGYLDCLPFGLLPISLLRTLNKPLYGYIFYFSLDNTLGWNGWVRWKMYVELFKKLLNYFLKFLNQSAVHEISGSLYAWQHLVWFVCGGISLWFYFAFP